MRLVPSQVPALGADGEVGRQVRAGEARSRQTSVQKGRHRWEVPGGAVCTLRPGEDQSQAESQAEGPSCAEPRDGDTWPVRDGNRVCVAGVRDRFPSLS